MSEQPSRADQGTVDHEYRITVTGTRRHTGKTVPLLVFQWHEPTRTWNVDSDSLLDKLKNSDPASVDAYVSAIRSRRHGRLTSDGTVWNFGKAKVPVVIMNVVLNAVRFDDGHSVAFDRILAVQSSKLGPRIKKLRGLAPEVRQHAEQLLYAEILRAL